MVNSFKVISFPTKTKIQIGKTTYLINSYFDKTGESLKEKISIGDPPRTSPNWAS